MDRSTSTKAADLGRMMAVECIIAGRSYDSYKVIMDVCGVKPITKSFWDFEHARLYSQKTTASARASVKVSAKYTVRITTYNPDWREVHDAYDSDDMDWGGDSIAERRVDIKSPEASHYLKQLNKSGMEECLKSAQLPDGTKSKVPWIEFCALTFRRKANLSEALRRWLNVCAAKQAVKENDIA